MEHPKCFHCEENLSERSDDHDRPCCEECYETLPEWACECDCEFRGRDCDACPECSHHPSDPNCPCEACEKRCERCGRTDCEEDAEFEERELWESNTDGKNICRACVAKEDAEDA